MPSEKEEEKKIFFYEYHITLYSKNFTPVESTIYQKWLPIFVVTYYIKYVTLLGQTVCNQFKDTNMYMKIEKINV